MRRRSPRSTTCALIGAMLLAAGCQPAARPVMTTGQATTPAAGAPAPGGVAPDSGTATPPDAPTGGGNEGPAPMTPPPRPTELPPLGSAGVNEVARRVWGAVTAPAYLIGDHGAGIISNNGANIISNNGGSIISNNGGSIISQNGAGFISKTKYRVLGFPSGPEGTIANALLYLTNRDEKFFLRQDTRQAFTTLTDSQGNYAFPIDSAAGFPVGKDVVVNAVLNDNLRMTGYMVPIDGENQLKLNLATTLATELLRADAYRAGKALGSYPRDPFYLAVSLTQRAIEAGDIEAVRQVTDQAGQTVTVGTFDLRMDHVADLRNQYAIALAAVPKASALMKQLSDAWLAVLGRRPTAVTTVLGGATSDFPAVADSGVQGDRRAGWPALAAAQVPTGYTYGVATSKRGDTFVAGYTATSGSGHIRWIKPDGTVTSIHLGGFTLATPRGLCVETEPGVGPGPGTLLVTDVARNLVLRVPILESAGGPVEVVAGATIPLSGTDPTSTTGPNFTPTSDPFHPFFVDGPATFTAIGTATPDRSRWRLAEEGVRTYRTGNLGNGKWAAADQRAAGAPVPNPARYATLNQPTDVVTDELGNIYICDKNNHRLRMIPKVANPYFGYRRPLDATENGDWNGNTTDDGPDGAIDGYAEVLTLQPGAIYTIAGDPRWDPDPAMTPDDGASRWFGDFADSDGLVAQRAKLDQPVSLAFRDGYLYICELDNNRVRRVSRATGIIETVVGAPPGARSGNGAGDWDAPNGTAGDGGQAALAELSRPRGIAFDAAGRLYIADTDSGRVRMVGTDGVITTVAGRLHAPSAVPTDNVTDGEALRWVDLYETQALDVDADGNVVLADNRHRRVRKLWRQWE